MGQRKYPKHPSESAKWAEKRVPHKLPVPKTCHYCEAKVEVRSHAERYGKNYSQWPWLYVCTNPRCKAQVGMHPYTKLPLGPLADADTRRARTLAKNRFVNGFLGYRHINRSEGYNLLACEMGIPVSQCHFGYFDVQQCREAWRALDRLGAVTQ